MLNFVCIYWDYHMIFIFQLFNMVYHIDWFVYIEESLHSWNKPKLIMVYELFDVLLNFVCWKFVEDICIYVHQWYWPVAFFFVLSLSGFGIRMMVASKNVFGSVSSSVILWKSCRRIGISSSLNVWLNYPVKPHLVLDFCFLGVLSHLQFQCF